MEITLCLIVLNEEKNLVKCLKSFQPLYSKIVVVDTGSTDKTKEVARQYGATVFDYQWDDNFSDARNFALSKATTEWIMMVDADDSIDGEMAKGLRKELGKVPSEVQGIHLPYLMPPYDSGMKVYRPRIWRKSLNARYKLAVHEYLNPTPEQLKGFIHLEYPVKHTTPNEQFQKSAERNIKILQEVIKEDPDEPRYYFYLGTDNQHAGHYTEAIEWYKRFTELPKINSHELNRVWVKMGLCHLHLQNKESAKKAFLEAIHASPEFIDPYLRLAEIEEQKGQYKKAADLYEKAMNCKIPRTHVVIHPNLYNGYAKEQLMKLLKKISPEI